MQHHMQYYMYLRDALHAELMQHHMRYYMYLRDALHAELIVE